jgi:tetratricopeptide (TPR) repeat protein
LRALHHPLHAEIEARLNAGSFEEAQRLLAQLGVGREHTHASTYFATRILYQRGKLDLPGVVARLRELLRSSPDFPEARAMLSAAERGTLRPDPSNFNQATVPPPPGTSTEDDDDGDRLTEPGNAPSSAPMLEARLKTPQAPGIPRAPLVPRFTPRENVAPSYAPPPDFDLTPPDGLDLDLTPPLPPSSGEKPWNDTLSAPPPSSTRNPRIDSPPHVAIDLGMLDGLAQPPLGERNTAPSPGAEPPSVFQIATWLSERDFERALSAVEQLGAESSPELSLLEVKALIGLGRRAAARRSLDRLCRAPLLDPDLRAAVARLLIELGDNDRAEAQARRAHAEDPASELSRLTLAWAVARGEAWLPSPRAAEELSELLDNFVPESCPLPGLGYALSALKLLQTSAAAARQAADAALALDGDAQDTLAVAAVVAQTQKRSVDAKRLYQRLLDVDNHAADELAATLARLDLPVGRHAPRPGPLGSAPPPPPLAPPSGLVAAAVKTTLAQGGSPWDDKEQRLAQGDSKAALFDFEQGLARRLEVLPARAGASELSVAALITARYLTESPISRHFAPFDLSLFSIARLDVALGLIYRGGVGPRTELRSRALLGLGAYSGECFRQAYAGEWSGGTSDLRSMHIEGQGLCFSPFRDMNARLQSAEPLEVGDTPLPHPGAEPLGQRVALSVAPPTPWDPAPWPEVGRLPELGARLRESPVGLYCAGIELPLDLSFASLRSLDRYVTLLAPPLAPSDPDAAWVKRASVLVGAYIGEVLRATRGGSWEATRGELRAEAYRIALPDGAKALPVSAAFERLSGKRLEQPSDYARRITG